MLFPRVGRTLVPCLAPLVVCCVVYVMRFSSPKLGEMKQAPGDGGLVNTARGEDKASGEPSSTGPTTTVVERTEAAESTVRDMVSSSTTEGYDGSLPEEDSGRGSVEAQLDVKAKHWDTYEEALKDQASEDKFIILGLVDSGFLDMACNFYLTSIYKFGIDNFLFIAVDATVCDAMRAQHGMPGDVPCFIYADDPAANLTSVYGSKDFHRKTNSRNDMILRALELGYTVLNSDVDVVFLANPIADVMKTCAKADCDIAPLWDFVDWNSGFIYIKPTKASMAMYERMIEKFAKRNQDDQIILNAVIREFEEQKKSLKLVELSRNKYINGKNFFLPSDFANSMGTYSCPECLVVHNNWIKGKHIKILRFKEHKLWEFDGDRYYSSTERKYLHFGNPMSLLSSEGSIDNLQWTALRNAFAIGAILNRTVILPQIIRPNGEPTPMYRFFERRSVKKFDEAFPNNYREPKFLQNPLVPRSVSDSRSATYFIQGEVLPSSRVTEKLDSNHVLTPKSFEDGPSTEEIRSWLGAEAAHILVFHSLYGKYKSLDYDALLGELGLDFFEQYGNLK